MRTNGCPAPLLLPAALAVALIASSAAAQDGAGWTVVSTGRITIKTRSVPGTTVREVLAIGVLDAPARDVQTAITATARYPHFMPYVKVARVLRPSGVDGGRIIYTRVSLPLVSDRDFVTHDRMTRSLDADGGGVFEAEWQVVEGVVPDIVGAVRIRLNTGRWRVTPSADGQKAHVEHQFVLDPGGQVPPFLADTANLGGVPDMFAAIEKEARLVRAAREGR